LAASKHDGVDKSVSSLPPWFQRWGIGACLVVGMVLVLIGAVWLLDQTSTIVDPLIAGFVLGAAPGASSTDSSIAVRVVFGKEHQRGLDATTDVL
jgi:hypothetical protein